ncbi:MAG: glycosyltransferase family 9 protein [Chitinophagaceae bacterium]
MGSAQSTSNHSPRHLLVFRFSALGDVAMTIPVIRLLLDRYPGLQVSLVSDPFMQPLTEGIERLHFYPADTKAKFRGIKGLYALSRQIRKDIACDAIADLHNVLRTKLLRFFLAGKPVAVIDKGRKEKKELTRPVDKKLRPLKTMFQRYADVFAGVGLPVQLNVNGGIVPRTANLKTINLSAINGPVAGIAPFAKHAAKLYPPDKMKEVVSMLSQYPGITILLFGSPAEAPILQEWEREIPHVYSLAGTMSFAEELDVIAGLDVMVSMDSANMHLASLYGIPVVSVWGGTHPFLGFYGWGQPPDNAVQLDLPCRPSSVFGNKPCPVHGNAGCMNGITPAMIHDKVTDVLKRG